MMNLNIPLFFEVKPACVSKWPYLFWTIVTAAVTLLAVVVAMSFNSMSQLQVCLPLCLGAFFTPFAIKMAQLCVLNWISSLDSFVLEPSIAEWLSREVKVFSGTFGMFYASVVLSICAIIAYYFGGTFDSASGLQILGLISIITYAGFIATVGIVSCFFLARLIWRLGRFKVKVERHSFGILSTGRTLMKCYVVTAIAWAMFTLSALAQLPHGWIPGAILAGPTILFFLTSFIISQFPLHNRMLEYKMQETVKLQAALNELWDKSTAEISESQKMLIDHLENRLVNVLSLPEWPFNLRSFAGAGASALMASLPVAIQLLTLVLKFVGDSPTGTAKP